MTLTEDLRHPPDRYRPDAVGTGRTGHLRHGQPDRQPSSLAAIPAQPPRLRPADQLNPTSKTSSYTTHD